MKYKLLDFYAVWCGPCKVLSKTIDKVIGNFENVELVKIDVVENDKAAVKYDVRNLPTLILTDDQDNILYRNTGLMTEAELITWLSSAIEP